MASLSLTSNAPQLAVRLGEIGVAVTDLDAPHADAARLVLGGVNPPRRSGKLAAAGRTDAGAEGWAITYKGVAYALTVHWGSRRRHIRAQPWLLREAQTDTDRIRDIYSRHVADQL